MGARRLLRASRPFSVLVCSEAVRHSLDLDVTENPAGSKDQPLGDSMGGRDSTRRRRSPATLGDFREPGRRPLRGTQREVVAGVPCLVDDRVSAHCEASAELELLGFVEWLSCDVKSPISARSWILSLTNSAEKRGLISRTCLESSSKEIGNVRSKRSRAA